MNFQEVLTPIESILPIVVGTLFGCLAFVGIHEFWQEFTVACRGGFQ